MPNWDFKYQTGGIAQGGPTVLLDPSSGVTGQWFGSVRVNSATGLALYPVATTRAASDSMIVLGAPRWVGISGPPSSAAPVFGVHSLVSGVGFILRAVASTAVVSFFVDWQLLNPKAP